MHSLHHGAEGIEHTGSVVQSQNTEEPHVLKVDDEFDEAPVQSHLHQSSNHALEEAHKHSSEDHLAVSAKLVVNPDFDDAEVPVPNLEHAAPHQEE